MKLLATTGPCSPVSPGKIFEIDIKSRATKELNLPISEEQLKCGVVRYGSGWIIVEDGMTVEDTVNGKRLPKTSINKRREALRRSSLLFLDRNYVIEDQVFTPKELRLKKSHQAVLYNDDLYITDTGHDRIVVYSLDAKTWKEIIIEPGMMDTKHINSIFFKNNSERNPLMYVLCHNGGVIDSTFRIFQDDKMVVEIPHMGKAAHNIWEMNGDIWRCDSSNGLLKSASGIEVKCYPFPRGVVVTENLLIVAVSVHHYKPDPNTRCGIKIFDKNTLKEMDFIPVENTQDIMELCL